MVARAPPAGYITTGRPRTSACVISWTIVRTWLSRSMLKKRAQKFMAPQMGRLLPIYPAAERQPSGDALGGGLGESVCLAAAALQLQALTAGGLAQAAASMRGADAHL
jgi:hypothetical protein